MEVSAGTRDRYLEAETRAESMDRHCLLTFCPMLVQLSFILKKMWFTHFFPFIEHRFFFVKYIPLMDFLPSTSPSFSPLSLVDLSPFCFSLGSKHASKGKK